MKSQDWHEALKSLTFADTASGQEVCEKSTGAEDKAVTVQKSPIHIVLERKGRGGKTATIICDLQLDDNDLKNLAADIKKRWDAVGRQGTEKYSFREIEPPTAKNCWRISAIRSNKHPQRRAFAFIYRFFSK